MTNIFMYNVIINKRSMNIYLIASGDDIVGQTTRSAKRGTQGRRLGKVPQLFESNDKNLS